MSKDFVEFALRERAVAANGLTVGDEQLRQAVQNAHRSAAPRPRRVRSGRMSFATGLACLMLGLVVASGATGTIGSALDPFLGGGDPPGAPLAQSELPSWLDPAQTGVSATDASVIASSGPMRLVAYRQGEDVCFHYGRGVGECALPAYFAEQLSESSWILRGPTAQAGEKKTLFGFVDASIASVRVEYADGSATPVRIENGGFVVQLDKARGPERVVGLDASGQEVATSVEFGV
ncbi:MAG TPA: hypothetical protein VMS60_06370 [Solirubrobacterales bacterium]|nr:hypothetical protein [Solirubrobacterales bacterium]